MEQLGYKNYYQVLNAKDYGIPQNRERVYTISIRKDIDRGNFKFPEKEELKLRLKDMLEDKVDKKYYLSEDKINKIVHWKAYQKPFEKVQGKNSICPTLTARGAGEEHSGMITYCDELDNTTNLQQKILIATANKKGYDEATNGDSINLAYPNSKTRRGRVSHQVAQTLTANDHMGVVVKKYTFNHGVYPRFAKSELKLRKLTPLECWRLMGFDDNTFEKAKEIGTSNTQLYKQAGNSIVVKVLEKIFKNLFTKECE